MNKTAIKNFAIWARNKLITDIQYRAGLMGITAEGIKNALPQSTPNMEFYDIGTAEPYSITGEAIRQRQKLEEILRQKEKESDYSTAYKYILEEVAYTWFNRLIAIRFMEVNDYLPSHIRVLSSESGKVEPDLVTTPFDAELDFTPDEQETILRLKTDNALDELFRLLFIKQCNVLNEILPALFEKTSDYTEVLLNISVVDQEGVVYHLIHDIDEDDFNIERGGQVEIIGWLYQYYNTEPKAAAFAKNGKITKEEIPAVTQLFTPDWIVRYMVENSLGRLWVEGHPDCGLKENWKYYLEEAQQEPEVQAKLSEIRKEYAALNPEDIKLIDPCMGSGHILVYAFDVLMQIYESAGYSQRDAAKSILEHNIYGLDIDDRAYQLAYFAVMMKARQYNRRILNGENTCHVYAIQESNSINRAHLKFLGAGLSDLEKNTAKMQLEGLLDILTDAKEYGSILNVESYNWDLLRRFVAAEDTAGQISMDSVGVEETAEELARLIDIGETMARKYWVTCTNPPYAGISGLSSKLGNLAQKEYPIAKTDLYSIFIERCNTYTTQSGFQAMITQQSWLSLPSFEDLRKKVCANNQIVTLAQLGAHAFDEIGGEVVSVVCFSFRKGYQSSYIGIYDDLQKGLSESEKEQSFLGVVARYYSKQDNFREIPHEIVVYDASPKALDNFSIFPPLKDTAVAKPGMQTSDNDRFLRLWFEVVFSGIGYSMTHEQAQESTFKWFPYNKGIGYRKWYGNNDYIVNFHNDGEELKYWLVHNPKDPGTKHWSRNMRNYDYYFNDGITFTAIGNSFSSRLNGKGYLFDTKGPTMFGEHLVYVCGFVNSIVFDYYNRMLCKQLTKSGDSVNLVPFCYDYHAKNIEKTIEATVSLSKYDWDSFETSWDFMVHPLVRCKSFSPEEVAEDAKHNIVDMNYVKEAVKRWSNECYLRFQKLKENEEELNRIFIDIYGLQDELTPEVEDKDITVHRVFENRDEVPDSMKNSNYTRTYRDEIVSLLSYAVGCMFGRYSIYKDGLLFAGEPYSLQTFADKLNDRPGTISAEELQRAYRNEGVVVDEMFFPDADNVIPITDEEYLDDDIVSRLCDWLKVVYGTDTLEANLDYIAKALGNKGSTSREVIRNYFVNDFFKDHCQTYSVTGSGKRPIYWLFDSGKQNGFKALVYLHRYTPDTIGNLRVDYLHKMQRVYESEIGRMQDMIDHSTNAREVAVATKRKEKLQKQLKECRDYDEMIAHLALSRIELDLDDGVKVNYRKIQTAADGKFYEVLADSKSIMAKEK